VFALTRLGGPERHAHAAYFAGGTMLALHAGVDWDWEMPALFVWLFGGAGVVLAAREGTARLGELSRTPRIVAALAVLVLALTPALMWVSQGPLERAQVALARNDCKTAIDASLNAIRNFGVRPEPWECSDTATPAGPVLARHAGDGRRPGARPKNWRYAYGQAIVDGVAGRDPLSRRSPGAAAEPAGAAGRHARARARPPKQPGPPARDHQAGGIPFE